MTNSSDSKIVSMTENKYTTNTLYNMGSSTNELKEEDFVWVQKSEHFVSNISNNHESEVSFDTIEEVIVEETEPEIDYSEISQKKYGPSTLGSYSKPIHIRTQNLWNQPVPPLDLESRILATSKNRSDKMISIEKAMNYKYTPRKNTGSKPTTKKPKNYPKNYKTPSDVVRIIDKMRSSSRERKYSSKIKIQAMMNRSGSSEAILTNSLKKQLSHRYLHSRSQSKSNRASSSKKCYKMSDFQTEVSKFQKLNLFVEQDSKKKNKKMHREAFDKIYKRFMNEKIKHESKINQIRKEKMIQEEIQINKMQKSQRRTGSKHQIDVYIQKVQDDIANRKRRVEEKRRQKSINEEKELKAMFIPKTNHKRLSHNLNIQHRSTHTNLRYDQNDYVTFEQSEPFNKDDFDFLKSNGRNHVRTNNVDFYQNANINKTPVSHKMPKENLRSNKTMNQGSESTTSFTTYETNANFPNHMFNTQKKSAIKSNMNSNINNQKTHKAWSDYINNIRDKIDTTDLPVKYLDEEFAKHH